MCIFTDHVFSYPYCRREDVSGINNKTIVNLTRIVFWKFLLPPECTNPRTVVQFMTIV